MLAQIDQDKRKAAMKWWNEMNYLQKTDAIERENVPELIGCRHPDDLTGREIEIVYNANTNPCVNLSSP